MAYYTLPLKHDCFNRVFDFSREDWPDFYTVGRAFLYPTHTVPRIYYIEVAMGYFQQFLLYVYPIMSLAKFVLFIQFYGVIKNLAGNPWKPLTTPLVVYIICICYIHGLNM